MSSSALTEKTLDVLQAVAGSGGCSMPEIQARCGLPLTTTYRIVKMLVERRFLMRAGKGEYRIGAAALSLGERLSCQDLLAAAARPHLLALSRRVKNHVHLGIWSEGMVAYLVKQRFGNARVHSAEGTRLEGYCSALGKVLLAGLPAEAVSEYVAVGGFVPLTPNTIVDPEQLTREIDDARRRGWACDDGEIVTSLRCIAVPIEDACNKVIAAISVSTVLSKPEKPDLHAFLEPLNSTADAIRRQVFG